VTVGKKILMRRTGGAGPTLLAAKKGDVWHLLIHGALYPSALRSRPPRVRLLEDQRDPVTRCELVDDWPDAPPEWPPPQPMGGLK